jgi:hypothetical protein
MVYRAPQDVENHPPLMQSKIRCLWSAKLLKMHYTHPSSKLFKLSGKTLSLLDVCGRLAAQDVQSPSPGIIQDKC